MNYTYILECSDGSLYTGWTNDLEKRVRAHNQGRGAKYTRGRRPVRLAYYEEHMTREEAMKREAAIKKLPRTDKELMIRKMTNEYLKQFSREELIELIEMYSKNWLADDGLWFQEFEKRYGMDAAMEADCKVWEKFTVIEANKIKQFLKLPEHPGIEGLAKALQLRFYCNFSKDEILIDGNTLTYRILECRVQHAREKKGMEFHPCKSVGEIEYGLFGKTIDDRFQCEALSCYPDITDSTCHCSWKYTLNE